MFNIHLRGWRVVCTLLAIELSYLCGDPSTARVMSCQITILYIIYIYVKKRKHEICSNLTLFSFYCYWNILEISINTMEKTCDMCNFHQLPRLTKDASLSVPSHLPTVQRRRWTRDRLCMKSSSFENMMASALSWALDGHGHGCYDSYGSHRLVTCWECDAEVCKL